MSTEKSDSTQELLKKADQLRLSGSYEESKAIYQQIVKQNPFLALGKLGLGRVYFESGDLANARAVLEEFSEFVPDHALANKILAKIYLHFSQLGKAKAKIQMVLSVSPEDSMAKKMLAEIEDEGSTQIRTLDDEDTKKNKAPANTATIAEIYRSQGHLKEALEIYKDLLKNESANLTYQARIEEIEQQLNPKASPVVDSEKETVELTPFEDSPAVHYEVSKPVHFVRYQDPEADDAELGSDIAPPLEPEVDLHTSPALELDSVVEPMAAATVASTGGKTRKEKLEELLAVVQQHRRG